MRSAHPRRRRAGPEEVLDGRLIPTPFGVDVEVFQSGLRIARLRAAGRCDSYGQAARCRFEKARTGF